mmetsp:Transcript_93612/g.288731  ORF Transcript_93612/g.288731 Transcript_93612/m.288731 type:complete len:529 (+) Transcript_93612:81-1667(+)
MVPRSLVALLIAHVSSERIHANFQLATDKRAETDSSELLTDQVREGSLFAGRFVMKHVLWVKALGNTSASLKHVPLPKDVKERFAQTKELYAGSFGEAWAAYDELKGRSVVLKFFYDTTQTGYRYHLSWAAAVGRKTQTRHLIEAAAECTTAQSLQTYSKDDPIGASRIMQCYEDHVTCDRCLDGFESGISTTGNEVTRSQALYQVLEDCSGDGGQPLSHWIKKTLPQDDYSSRMLMLFKELMEGLHYLTNPKHPVNWIHHDLKPDNLVVKRRNGQEYLKIIDLGAVLEVTEDNVYSPAASTVLYAPPEWFETESSAVAFDIAAPWSFDMYSAGNILIEMATGEALLGRFWDSLPSSQVKLIKIGCPAGDGDCVQQGMVDAAKAKESVTTKAWSSNPADESISKFLYGGDYKDFQKTAASFLEEAKKQGFWEVHVKMFVSEPSKRPTPAEVLETPLMKGVTTHADPEAAGGAERAQANGIGPKLAGPKPEKHQLAQPGGDDDPEDGPGSRPGWQKLAKGVYIRAVPED